jgi:hypothetical protein
MKFLLSTAFLAFVSTAEGQQSLRASEQEQRDLLYVDQAYATAGGDECNPDKGVWKNVDDKYNPCNDNPNGKNKWKGKGNNEQGCGGGKRDVKLYIKTDSHSDEDSFFFTSSEGKGVPATTYNGDDDTDDTLVRPIATLEDNEEYVWEACLDVPDGECFFFDFYTQKTSGRGDFGFVLISDGVLQLHMSTSDDTFEKQADKDNNDIMRFKRVSLGTGSCPTIDKVMQSKDLDD